MQEQMTSLHKHSTTGHCIFCTGYTQWNDTSCMQTALREFLYFHKREEEAALTLPVP